jgi:hypothetical protein
MTEQAQAGSVLSIRVTEDERASLEAAAQQSRTTLSDVASSAFERGSQVARPKENAPRSDCSARGSILTHICQLILHRKTGSAVILSVVKRVPNTLLITPPNTFSRTIRPTEKTVSAMHSI